MTVFLRLIFIALLLLAVPVLCAPGVARAAQDASRYEGRTIESVEVRLEGAPRNEVVEAELLSLLRVRANTEYSSVAVREALQTLFDSGRVANARVEVGEASGAAGAPVRVQFVVRPQARVAEVFLQLGGAEGAGISEDELRARLNMLEPGARASDQVYRTNADLIQIYLRDRGFYRADVGYEQQLDPSGTRATVTFRVNLGEQARVEAFNINVAGFDVTSLRPTLRLQTGAPFSQSLLGEDMDRIRQALIRLGYLAPQLNDPQVIYDPATNRVTVNLRGSTGPKVEVALRGYELSDRKARELLPVRREGSIDISAIVEGARRLRNRLQEEGYFFAEVTARCAVVPPLPNGEANVVVPGEEQDRSCESLNPEELSGRAVTITYDVAPSRRFKLTDVRLEGTDKLSIEEVRDVLRTQEATALGFIPLLGYGRGYTSRELIERDRGTIRQRMQELGYRRARVDARQSVSIDGENLVITFVVEEGPLTRVADVEIRGNQIYTAERLRDERCRVDEPCTVVGGAFSRAQARSDGERLLGFYARNGYASADVRFDIVELPATQNGDERVRIIYTITEGGKVFINRIFVNGNVRTEREAMLEALPLKEGEVLRGDQLTESERILYNTGAFRQVIIRTEGAGETASGFAKRDIIIDVEELKPRDLVYGGGFSTDAGPLGIFEFRNSNLFGKLRQAALRTRASRRQQLFQLEYIDPRFRRYGERAFAPLTIAAQYQRDTGVTRFFRSTIDRGNQGIVQRLDEEGNPIDLGCLNLNPDPTSPFEPCEPAGEPTINRFTFNVETRRDFQFDLGPRGEVLRRSTLFLRYSYEDVRLYNINSLLLRDILQPDRTVRLSRLGTSFVRDTRDDQTNATRGDFLRLDYGLALRQLGGNLSFNRFSGTYNRYFQLDAVRRGTVLAGSATLGLANVFNPRDRNENGVIDEIDRTLPISERFFAGGASSLRGFAFEEAGPRRVIVPQGTFRNREGEEVTLQPFTVPVGGNALAVVNLEARVPLTQRFQVVPFYDGGNVFRSARDIFRRNDDESIDPNLRARWTHTVGLGLRLRTPFGALGVDYGYLLNPPVFTAFDPQTGQPIALPQLRRGQIHVRFGQAF